MSNAKPIYVALSLIVVTLICCHSCKNSRQKGDEVSATIIAEWQDRKIRFTDNIACRWYMKDTIAADILPSLLAKPYKVVMYLDSILCAPCNLELAMWQSHMEEADSLFPHQVSFLYYIQPQSQKTEELYSLLQFERFDHPVFVDSHDRMDSLNNFPTLPTHSCFLIDKDNRVQVVGNPALNAKIWKLYKKVIAGGSP